MDVNLRPPTATDADACGRLIYDAFASIADLHNFPRDFESSDRALAMAHAIIDDPGFWGVAAEADGRLVGCNFLDERGAIRGVGPLCVHPDYHGRGIGRRLMRAVLDRGKDAAGIRLVQDAFNTVSMPLYASLGFEVKEPLALMTGRIRQPAVGAPTARPMRAEDVPACAALCQRVHGFDRGREVEGALAHFKPFVLVREGRICAYCSAPTYWFLNHGVAENVQDMEDLLRGVSAQVAEPLGLLLPTRQAELFRWCLGGRIADREADDADGGGDLPRAARRVLSFGGVLAFIIDHTIFRHSVRAPQRRRVEQ